MANPYTHDRPWSDRYLPTVKRIVGQRLLVESPFEIDAKQAADLIVLTGRDMTIAARVRRPGYADKWPYEFTVRSRRDSGARTELEKILAGWGDWFFYGHADDDITRSVSRWMLLSLDRFRNAVNDGLPVRSSQRANGDGTYFVAYDVRSFPAAPPLLLDASFHYHELVRAAA